MTVVMSQVDWIRCDGLGGPGNVMSCSGSVVFGTGMRVCGVEVGCTGDRGTGTWTWVCSTVG